MFTQNREQMRQFFNTVWQKHQQEQKLEPLETIVRDVMLAHPEYQNQLTNPDVGKDYLPEMGQTNPFLHVGLHIALHEQLMTNRPIGIRALYTKAVKKIQDKHEVEHKMMDCLAESLWTAQRNHTTPDEQSYVQCLKKHLS
ncbi:DUF1841 family protein [Candidatus Albibeggiatoa sp. nov. NOAA]|uniref:DUF1841 family protein n=1 Tax=Candidatus Albibeggiatoa sp. nov. NOAA TaxID=3162724 RepID=UPI0032FA8B7D|nr:DUF1841 family protein [Thiotrichaceae bacterium]